MDRLSRALPFPHPPYKNRRFEPHEGRRPEPYARRQDTIALVDFRVEKQLRFAQKAKLGLFFDLFNAMNSNVAVNENWRSGAAFEKATTVLGPRIAKFGVKFDW